MSDAEADPIRALVERAAAGDQAAVADLLGMHLEELRAFVRRRMGAPLLRRESSSDIVQSVCREVLEKADRFQHPESNAFRRWLYTMAERKLGHRYEYHGAERRAADREADLGEGVEARDASPTRQASAREELARVEAAFERLPEHYRDVIVQARILGMSREQIGAASGRAPAAVGNLLFRALAALAAELEDEHGPGSG